jgi:hypothetical protein
MGFPFGMRKTAGLYDGFLDAEEAIGVSADVAAPLVACLAVLDGLGAIQPDRHGQLYRID